MEVHRKIYEPAVIQAQRSPPDPQRALAPSAPVLLRTLLLRDLINGSHSSRICYMISLVHSCRTSCKLTRSPCAMRGSARSGQGYMPRIDMTLSWLPLRLLSLLRGRRLSRRIVDIWLALYSSASYFSFTGGSRRTYSYCDFLL
jgi:hypothetical protein